MNKQGSTALEYRDEVPSPPCYTNEDDLIKLVNCDNEAIRVIKERIHTLREAEFSEEQYSVSRLKSELKDAEQKVNALKGEINLKSRYNNRALEELQGALEELGQ